MRAGSRYDQGAILLRAERLMEQAEYDHVQTGRVHWLLHVFAVGLLAGAYFTREPAWVAILLGAIAVLFVVLGFAFRHLRVRSAGEGLEIRFGPLPLASKRVSFADVRALSVDRTRLLEGIGIHALRPRCWTWNVAMGPCVQVETERLTLRIGTDDPDGLLAFLRRRTGLSAADGGTRAR